MRSHIKSSVLQEIYRSFDLRDGSIPLFSISCPAKLDPLRSHFTFFGLCFLLYSALSSVRSIKPVQEDIGMLQTPVFSYGRGEG
jgi:hypothetical protein